MSVYVYVGVLRFYARRFVYLVVRSIRRAFSD